MKKSIKALVALLIISTAFTSCTSENNSTPTPAPIDIRDAAEGTFQSDFAPIRLVFEKSQDSIGQMLLLDYETNEVNAVMFIIMETMEGFTYGFKDDVMLGRYNKVEDTHTLVEPDNTEWYFLRVN
mgnify:FL=1|tara:strand:+ start:187 stop:564 length:378 start_codon:yes stop_codon:yes gene_type:complete